MQISYALPVFRLTRVGMFTLMAASMGSCTEQPATPPPAAPTHHVIPAPARVDTSPSGTFTLAASTTIRVPAGNEPAARLGRYLSDIIGISAGPEPIRVESGSDPSLQGHIQLVVGAVDIEGGAGEEGYELRVTPEGVTITAPAVAGLFYGLQTLRHLLPPWIESEAVRADPDRPVTIHSIHIVDRPRFAWRGAMLDVARHFFSVEDVKRYIDLIALQKLNRLHLHLADDQGWRIEIKSWPRLTTKGGLTEVGGGPGGYYTQAQYREIVAYAAERFVTIVPEIDMPGHTNAALASYAELNCDGKSPNPYTGIDVGFSAFCVDKPITYKFIDDVVREISAMTTGPYFHIGGDEVKTLTPAQYTSFIERVQKIVQSHGKQMIGWDEISAAALVPTSLVQHWRPDGSPEAAVGKGSKVIMSVANRAYLDMKYDKDTALGQNWAAYINVKDSYAWDPATVAKGVPESAILGVEAPIWTETLATMRDVEYLAFPRMAAVAEVAWSPQGTRTWEDFSQRLGAQEPRWSALGINFYRSPTVPWAP